MTETNAQHFIDTKLEEYYSNKRVLITGGTKGLGRSLTLLLDQLGAKISVVARTEKDLNELNQISDTIFTIPADISNKQDIHKISGQAIGMMEGVDILFNNASTLGITPLQQLADTECEILEKVLQTNLLGPFRLIKAILPAMKFMDRSIIVNISSDAAVNPYPTWGPYSISKVALDHMSAIWSGELDNHRINIISLDPGDMYTEMHMAAIPDANPDTLYQPSDVAKDLLLFLSKGKFDQHRYSATQWRELI